MIKVGITGGIGTGKSVVCKVFESLGIKTYNADIRAKQLVLNHPQLKQAIIAHFGSEAYLANGQYNRSFIAQIVFNDSQKLAQLNELIHPVVFQDFEDWCKTNQHEPYVIKEAALMIESGSHLKNDFNILVTAPHALRLARVAARDGLSTLQIEKIIANQLPESEKLSFANFIIHNDGAQSLIEQVFKIHHQLIAKQ